MSHTATQPATKCPSRGFGCILGESSIRIFLEVKKQTSMQLHQNVNIWTAGGGVSHVCVLRHQPEKKENGEVAETGLEQEM